MCHHWQFFGTHFLTFIMLGHFHYGGPPFHYVGQHDGKQLENKYKFIMLGNIIIMLVSKIIMLVPKISLCWCQKSLCQCQKSLCWCQKIIMLAININLLEGQESCLSNFLEMFLSFLSKRRLKCHFKCYQGWQPGTQICY